ncbi:hypothetical protein, partial [Hyphomonas chukchiensis]|uniref:hypothetical protein n=1 Tax=Hyphomonas chukchiensis TaxID=1280947 RepID=UPI0030F8252F
GSGTTPRSQSNAERFHPRCGLFSPLCRNERIRAGWGMFRFPDFCERPVRWLLVGGVGSSFLLESA